jgi:hypothetical protein
MEVVTKDDNRTGPSANELAKYVSGNLTPREAPKDGRAYSDLQVCSKLKDNDGAKKKGSILQGLRGLRKYLQRPKHPGQHLGRRS